LGGFRQAFCNSGASRQTRVGRTQIPAGTLDVDSK
jgi:hypothetical protein